MAGGGAYAAARDGAPMAGGAWPSARPRTRVPPQGPRGRDRATRGEVTLPAPPPVPRGIGKREWGIGEEDLPTPHPTAFFHRRLRPLHHFPFPRFSIPVCRFPWGGPGGEDAIRPFAAPLRMSWGMGNGESASPFPIPTIPHSRLPIPRGRAAGGGRLSPHCPLPFPA